MSNESPFSTNSIKQSLEKLEDIPKEEANVGVVVQGNDVGVTGSVSKDLGNPGGWEVAAEGTWMRWAGAKFAALFKWKGE